MNLNFKLVIFGVLQLAIQVANAGNAYENYPTASKKYMDLPGSIPQVKNMPLIKDQDDLGLCYGFVASSLLEHFNCKTKNLDCAKISNKERISVLFTSSYTTEYGHLSEGGDAYRALLRLEKRHNNLISEQCAPYDQILKSGTYEEGGNLYETTSHKVGWELFNTFINLRDESGIEAKIRAELPKLTITDPELINSNVSSMPNVDSMRDSLLLPEHCASQQTLQIQPYKAFRYPVPKDQLTLNEFSVEKLDAQIKKMIDQDTPVGMNLCIYSDSNRSCDSAHVLIISGYKTACLKGSNKCDQLLYKVHNSYGNTWQKKKAQGWIKAEGLLNQAVHFFNVSAKRAHVLTWIEPASAN